MRAVGCSNITVIYDLHVVGQVVILWEVNWRSFVTLFKQGVALTGRNITLLARHVLPPGELRCIWKCYRQRQMPVTIFSLAPYKM